MPQMVDEARDLGTFAVSTKAYWTGQIIGALMVLFLLFDGTIHLLKVAPVVEAFTRLGYPISLSRFLGIAELVCVLIYLFPATTVLGAILLTGYLGGAVATHLRAGSPVSECIFPIIVGVLLWTGIFLRDARLRTLIPLRG